MGISVCMVIKNEEEVLMRCLNSVSPIADELIVVDTGSTDSTKDIARSFGAKVHDFEWVDDFAAAKNFALEKATGNWILFVDADETISAPDRQKVLKAVKDSAVTGYRVIMRTYTNDTSSPMWVSSAGDMYEESTLYAGWAETRPIRLFQKGLKFERKVHETVLPSIEKQKGTLKQSEIVMHHYGKVRGDAYTQKKGEAYLKLGEEKVSQERGTHQAKAQFELGVQASRLGDRQKSIEAFQKALELDPSNVRVYMNLGAEYIRIKEIDKAVKVLEKGKSIEPSTALLNNLGVAYEQKGMLVEAMDTYHDALKIEKVNIEAYENIARLYYFAKNYEQLIVVLGDIITLNPKKIETYHNLAGIYLQLGKISKAVEVLQKAVKVDDSNAQTFLNLGKALAGDARIDDAIEALKKASTLDNSLKESCDKIITHLERQYHS